MVANIKMPTKTRRSKNQVSSKTRFFVLHRNFSLKLNYICIGKKCDGPNKTGNPFKKFQNGKGKFQKPAAGKFQKFDKPIKSEDQAKPAPPEKVDWNKFKQEKKELKQKRKAAKTGFEKVNEAKQIYEKLKWFVPMRLMKIR